MKNPDVILPKELETEALKAVLCFVSMSPQERRDAMMFMSGVRAAQGIQSAQSIRPTA